MKHFFRSVVALAIICVMIIGTTATVFAYNGINSSTIPILDSNSRSLNGATWTPYASRGYKNLQFHPGDKTMPTQRLYPKPDGATLPIMGWNSWNAFFSWVSADRIADNAKAMIDRGLNKVGYKEIIIDDGCYGSISSQGTPTAKTDHRSGVTGTTFAAYAYNGKTGFSALSDYVHGLGLGFGMYNDSGGSTCAGQPGAYPSAGGREDTFAAAYVGWGIDVLKYDYCGNPLNNATNIASINVQSLNITNTTGNPTFDHTTSWASASPGNVTYIGGASRNSSGYLAGLGVASTTTYYTTNTLSGACVIRVDNVPVYGTYNIGITRMNGTGRYIMVDVNGERQYEALTSSVTAFPSSPNTTFTASLKAGTNLISIYNTKAQDIGLYNFTSIRDAFQKAPTVVAGHPGQNVAIKTCEWANNASWQWAYMVGESNRLYADIFGTWNPNGTWGYMLNEYNRAVYLTTNDYAPLGSCWPDADMLMVGLGPYTSTTFPNREVDTIRWSIGQNRQHYNIYAMINAPLLLGFDMRNDILWENLNTGVDGNYIINNRNINILHQDPYGIAGKRIKVSSGTANSLITGATNRVDYLAKPLSNGDVAVCATNFYTSGTQSVTLTVSEIRSSAIFDLIINKENFTASSGSPIYVLNCDTGAVGTITSDTANIFAAIGSNNVPFYDCFTYRLSKTPFTEGWTANSNFGVGISFDQIDFVGGEMQIGTGNGAPGGTPIMYRNRAIGLATVNNNTGATVNAAIQLELFNAKGVSEWKQLGPTKSVENGWLLSWEYKVDLPDIVVGHKLTATLINAATGLPFDTTICPSYTRYAAVPKANGVELTLAGFARTFKTANENPGSASATLSSMDTELVATNPITATGTVFNETDKNINAKLLTVLYNADGSVANYQLSPTAVIVPEDNVTFSDKFFLPSDVAGKYIRSFLLDADTLKEIGPDASYPSGSAGAIPSAAGVASDGGYLVQGGDASGFGVIRNDTDAPVSALLLIARYNAQGALVDAKPSTAVEVKPGAFGLLSIDYKLPSDATAAGQTVKVFLWDAVTFIPLVKDVSQTIFKAAPANKVELVAVIATASALNPSDYSQATAAALTAALNAAIAVNADIAVLQADVDAAVATLKAAINALVVSPRTTLGLQITAAKGYDQGNYTQATAGALAAAIATAEAVYNNTGASDAEWLAQIPLLQAAINALVFSPRYNLGQLLITAKALNWDGLTSESVAKLTAAIASAEAVYENAASTDTEINAQITLLQAAIDGRQWNTTVVDLTRAAVYTFAEGNLARHADVIQLVDSSVAAASRASTYNKTYSANNPPVGITASYVATGNGNNNVFAYINNGLLVGETQTGVGTSNYNTYGSNSGPHYAVIRWNNPYTISSTRVMWWYDGTASTSGVTLPSAGSGSSVTTLQYWNASTSSWVSVTNLKNAGGDSVSNIGVAGGGTGNTNRTWNGVTFDPVVTDRVRLVIQKGVGNGMGIGEWEVFGS